MLVALLSGCFEGLDPGSDALGETTRTTAQEVEGSQANLPILPIALDKEVWDGLQTGGSDNWKWDSALLEVAPGTDGVYEANLYPGGTRAPGNFGTVDIGHHGNSTADLVRQILYGVTPEDLAPYGGALTFDASDVLILNGDTGISAGIADALTQIIGQPRTVGVFRSVTGTGDNAQYEIVKLVGVRVMSVDLMGALRLRHVTIQPAPIGGAI
jgi:hypothetical protein